MKALTLYQPYASGMAKGLKRVETRPPWAVQLAAHVGEDMAVHAGAGADWPKTPGLRAIYLHKRISHPLWSAMRDSGLFGEHPIDWTAQHAPLGAVVAVVRIVAVHRILVEGDDPEDLAPYVAADPDDNVRLWTGTRLNQGNPLVGWTGTAHPHTAAGEAVWGNYERGRVAVLTDNVRELAEPVPCRGYQRAWNLPDEVESAVLAQIGG